MRKVLCYLIILLEIFLFTACQATPDNEIIKYSSETQYEADPVSKNENDSVLSKVPEHLEASFSEYGGRLEITIDADVETASKNSWPVYRTKLYYFTQEDVDQFVTGLFEPDAIISMRRCRNGTI